MKYFITGAAGYIGGMLSEIFLGKPETESVVSLDMRDARDAVLLSHPKSRWVSFNLGDEGWQKEVLKSGVPDIVIHSAYLIRQGYGKRREFQIKSNITAADKVFDFAFRNNVPVLIHFSTVASYGALPTNSVDQRFTEEHPFREENYLYGVDKKVIEESLRERFEKEKALFNKGERKTLPKVFIIRPCAITGPRGQFMFRRFGLLHLIKKGLPIVPLTGAESARQFVHEDDIASAVEFMVANANRLGQYEIFNLAPEDHLLLSEMARLIGKKTVRVPMALGKFTFAALWHLSRGRIPTVPAGIASYTYPIVVDGSRITKFGFSYKYNSKTALAAQDGYYRDRAGSNRVLTEGNLV